MILVDKLIDNISIFESIKHIDDNGIEFWYARDLQKVLNYSQWRRFENVIDKAKIACIQSKNSIQDDFADAGKIVKAGATTKKVSDIKLTRYACYLIMQNADPRSCCFRTDVFCYSN